jgi:hypothetical protein
MTMARGTKRLLDHEQDKMAAHYERGVFFRLLVVVSSLLSSPGCAGTISLLAHAPPGQIAEGRNQWNWDGEAGRHGGVPSMTSNISERWNYANGRAEWMTGEPQP